MTGGPPAADVDLVIFDCDGVLIDSEVIACGADAELLTEIGYPITMEQVSARFAGVPYPAIYAEIEQETGRPMPSDFAGRVKARILEKYRTELLAIDGVADLLARLRIPRCVASSSEPAKLALGLIETGLYEALYPHIFSATLVPRGKPHPDIFLYAAEQMGVPPARCLVVEDSVAGATAARAAGMRCLGFAGGAHCAPGHDLRLREAGVLDVLQQMRDLTDWVA
ncbi:MAG: HAD-IA family hydrolase [Pseudomonadota bacterium]